jgi:HlyD family secretion protein
MITRNKFLLMVVVAFLFNACQPDKNRSDAYGNFEADETLVSAESSGRLLQFNATEGMLMEKNQVVGLVDTVAISLQLYQLAAQKSATATKIPTIDAQIQIYLQQKENLEIDLRRIENMTSAGAATQKQLDDIKGQIAILDKQVNANQIQKSAVSKELAVLDANASLLNEQLHKCTITNPVKGTVLEKYAEPGEVTAAGKPLYKIADVSVIILRVYVSGGQLSKVKLGGACKVFIDEGKDNWKEYSGNIRWVSQQAEFTPKIIQTHDERVNMVYAVKILVPNDGSIKIGMPGEVRFD